MKPMMAVSKPSMATTRKQRMRSRRWTGDSGWLSMNASTSMTLAGMGRSVRDELPPAYTVNPLSYQEPDPPNRCSGGHRYPRTPRVLRANSRKTLTPLWLSLANLVTPEPNRGCRPAAWTFADIRAAMIDGGCLITAKRRSAGCWCSRIPASAANRRSRRTSTPACSSCYPERSPRPSTCAKRAPLRPRRPALTPPSTASGRDARGGLHYYAPDGVARSLQWE